MKYHIITTQPKIYEPFFLNATIFARAISKKIISVDVHNLHDFAFDKHGSIDDNPYGGGPGMVLRVDVLSNAIKKIKRHNSKVILLTPQGKKFNQSQAKKLAQEKNLILIAGRFEGYDERIRDLADEEISIGDYVLTAGDLPALVIIDAVSRHIPGFIDRAESIQNESFEENLLEYPQYTRPCEFNGKKIPDILLSGDHRKIANWRKEESIKRTRKKRPDLT